MTSENETLTQFELLEAWPALSPSERVEGFLLLSRGDAEEIFERFDSSQQAELLMTLPAPEQRLWLRSMAPDDAADALQTMAPPDRDRLCELLDDTTRREVNALLAYEEDAAGGLMNPRFARLRGEMSADEAIAYLRRQTRERVENIYYGYVLDAGQRLEGVVSMRQLVTAPPTTLVREIMKSDLVTIPDDMDQEAVSGVFANLNLMALPVVDSQGCMKGIVTVDDIVDVVREEATEDIQKIGGMQALEQPYLQAGIGEMIRKRAGWLMVLFLGQTLTASVMAYFSRSIEATVMLALFVPLIISSGGNAGSQAATLVVRALALGEVRLQEWWRVIRLEAVVGVMLGVILALLGLARILLWEGLFGAYGSEFLMLGLVIALSLVGVVAWGTLSGALLPLVLRRLGFDPASASTPFVATLCDVAGLMIYFTIATLLLRPTPG